MQEKIETTRKYAAVIDEKAKGYGKYMPNERV